MHEVSREKNYSFADLRSMHEKNGLYGYTDPTLMTKKIWEIKLAIYRTYKKSAMTQSELLWPFLKAQTAVRRSFIWAFLFSVLSSAIEHLFHSCGFFPPFAQCVNIPDRSHSLDKAI